MLLLYTPVPENMLQHIIYSEMDDTTQLDRTNYAESISNYRTIYSRQSVSGLFREVHSIIFYRP